MPATKAILTEFLPNIDKPAKQDVVEEAIAAGLTILIFITGHSKRAIGDNLAANHELKLDIDDNGMDGVAKTVRNIVLKGLRCVVLRQFETLGPNHEVLCSEPAVARERFAALLACDVLIGKVGDGVSAGLIESRPPGAEASRLASCGRLHAGGRDPGHSAFPTAQRASPATATSTHAMRTTEGLK